MMKYGEVPTGVASFPYLVNDPDELPTGLQQLARQALTPGEPISTIFVVPAQAFISSFWFGRRYVPEQALLFTPTGVLHVQDAARRDQAGQVTYLRSEELLYAQISLLLLYGCLELVGRVQDVLSRVTVEFNTVGHNLLDPALHRFLRQAWVFPFASDTAKIRNRPMLDELERISLKFRNGLALYGLQTGERLLGYVFQPGIWLRRWRIFNRQVSATTLLALTDQQLIIVEEECNGEPNAHGWIISCFPRAALTRLETQPEKSWQELQVRLARGEVAVDRRVKLSNEVAAAWQDVWQSCNKISHSKEQDYVSTTIDP